MSLPKKGLRKITVDGIRYGWVASGDDGYINLVIGLYGEKGTILNCWFSYHHDSLEWFNDKGEWVGHTVNQRFVISSGIVKQVILYAIAKGWKPEENGKSFNLGRMDNEIDLQLRKISPFPELADGQVALNFMTTFPGKYLNSKMNPYTSGDEIYLVFHSLEEAKQFARETVQQHPEIRCWIKTSRIKAVCLITAKEEKDFVE